ncbi:hypothetical protein ACV3P9_14915 [Clostridium perfringens]
MNFYQTIITTLVTIIFTTFVNAIVVVIKQKFNNKIKEFNDLKIKTIEILIKYEDIIIIPYYFGDLERDFKIKELVYKAKLDIRTLAAQWSSFYIINKKGLFSKNSGVAKEVSCELIALSNRLFSENIPENEKGNGNRSILNKIKILLKLKE